MNGNDPVRTGLPAETAGSALTVPGAGSVPEGERVPGRDLYLFLRDELGAGFIQFIPIIERATEQTLPAADAGWERGVNERPLYVQEGNLVTHRSVGPAQYGRFLIDVFEEWVRRDIGTVYVQMFDTALANWYGEGGGMCVHAKTCGSQLALEHNGDLYSCDHYVEPGYLLGNIGDRHMLELIASPAQRKFGQDKHDTLTRYCRDCDIRFACNGGCPKDRFAVSPYGEPGQHYLCPGYQDFFHHIAKPMDTMAGLLPAGRAPAELRLAARSTRRLGVFGHELRPRTMRASAASVMAPEDRFLTEAAVTQKTHCQVEHHHAMPPLHHSRRSRCAVGACDSHGALHSVGFAFCSSTG